MTLPPPLASPLPMLGAFVALLGSAEMLRRRLRVAPDVTRALVQAGVAASVVITGPRPGAGPCWLLAFVLYLSFRFELLAAVEDDGPNLGPTLWPVACALLLTWFPDERSFIAVTAILGAGIGDPLAGVVGRRLGTRRFRTFGSRRSMEGTFTLFTAAGATMAPALVVFGELGWHQAVAFSLIAATVAASVEAISLRGTDNVTVPLATAATLRALLTFSQ